MPQLLHAPSLPKGEALGRLAARHRGLPEWAAATVRGGHLPVLLAGDCLAAIPILTGLQRAGIGPVLIWFDAHGDFNTSATSPSGYLGGMALAMLVGRGDLTLCRAAGARPLPEERLILTDTRELVEPGERQAVASSRLAHLTQVRGLRTYPSREQPLGVHVDTDPVRAEDAQAQNYLAPGGPVAAELAEVFRFLAGSQRVVAVSVSCGNPALDTPQRDTQRLCLEL